MHGQFIVGFPLSFHLNPIEHTSKIKSNIVPIEKHLYTEHEYQALPKFFMDEKLAIVPKNWQLDSREKNYLDSINIINEKSILLEQENFGLTEKKEWFFVIKGGIETCRAHRILIRQRNFDSLANKILFLKEDLPQSVKENMRHEKAYEIARERYHNVMCFYLNRDVNYERLGLQFNHILPWIAATPDGLISDASNNNDAIGILRIVCPGSLRNSDIVDILSDSNFFIKENKGVLVLKRDHHEGHFTNCQLQMDLCGAGFCDIAVFVFNGMINGMRIS